tara:strand:- start:169 stop:465 length:297 start_codon:yes stop_codon:yes gene_type:complete
MDKIDHIAIQTKNINESVIWYTKTFSCDVLFQDKTWALLEFNNIKLALVVPEQHPPHIAVKRRNLEKYGNPVKHRDGSESVYINSPDKNVFELIRYPE